MPRKEARSKRDHSDKLVRFRVFAQILVVVILCGASKYCGRFSKVQISENFQSSAFSAFVFVVVFFSFGELVYPEQWDAGSTA